MRRSDGVIAGIMIAAAVLAFPSGAFPADRAGETVLEVFTGAVHNFRLPLVIRQRGAPDLSFRAGYDTRPFEPPLYYSVRVSRWKGDSSWEGEFVHHKLFLRNPPPEADAFSISHGYNQVTVNRAARRSGFVYRLGLGVVLAHPETTIRGRKHSEKRGLFKHGYFFAGPTLQLSAGRPVSLGGGFRIVPEVKLTGSFARIPVSGGNADAPNVALHGLLGLGYGR